MSAIGLRLKPSERAAAARGTRSRRRARLLLRVGLVRLLVAVVASLARGVAPGKSRAVGASVPSGPTEAGGTTGAANGFPGGLNGLQTSPAAGSLAGGFSGKASAGGAELSGAPSAPTASYPVGAPSATSPPSGGRGVSDKPAVITPALAAMRFGSMVGLPLLCNIAASAVTGGIPDAKVAAVAGQITHTCAEVSAGGVSGIDVLNQRLSALAAANPAVDPVLDQLATIVGAAGTGSPLADFFTQVAALILFFK